MRTYLLLIVVAMLLLIPPISANEGESNLDLVASTSLSEQLD